MTDFYPLTVTAIRRETRDSVVVTLSPRAEQRELFRFQQGQYLTFRKTFDDGELRRSYSICAAVQDEQLRVGIKKIPGGVFSTWANEQLQPGEVLEAMTPMGSFYVTLEPARRKHYAAFAAGSGITPILSILKTTLQSEPRSRFTLFYGNRASAGVMFREELEDLKNQHLGRFNLVHILSREQQDIELFNGRIDRDKCEQLCRYWLDVANVDHAFICGPQDMMLAVADVLRTHGLARHQIKFELFASEQTPRRRRTSREQQAHVGSNELCDATIILDGRSRSLTLPRNRAILDGAQQEGVELPYACKAGVCSTCRALLLEGEVDMDANFALEDYEIARGYILTCQSYPVSDRIVVDFDH